MLKFLKIKVSKKLKKKLNKTALVKEDFFGPIYEGKLGRSFWIQAISFLLVFEIGLAVGLTIGGNAL